MSGPDGVNPYPSQTPATQGISAFRKTAQITVSRQDSTDTYKFSYKAVVQLENGFQLIFYGIVGAGRELYQGGKELLNYLIDSIGSGLKKLEGKLNQTKDAAQAEKDALIREREALENVDTEEAEIRRAEIRARIVELDGIIAEIDAKTDEIREIDRELRAPGITEKRALELLQRKTELERETLALQQRARVIGGEVAEYSQTAEPGSEDAALVVGATERLAVFENKVTIFVGISGRLNDFLVGNLSKLFRSLDSLTVAMTQIGESYKTLLAINASKSDTISEIERIKPELLAGVNIEIDGKTVLLTDVISGLRSEQEKSGLVLRQSVNEYLIKIQALGLAVDPALQAGLLVSSGMTGASYEPSGSDIVMLKSSLNHLDYIIGLLSRSGSNEKLRAYLKAFRKEIEIIVRKGEERRKGNEVADLREEVKQLGHEVYLLRIEIAKILNDAGSNSQVAEGDRAQLIGKEQLLSLLARQRQISN